MAGAVAQVLGYQGSVRLEGGLDEDGDDFILDTQRLRSTGWAPQVSLETGLAHMYREYQQRMRNQASA